MIQRTYQLNRQLTLSRMLEQVAADPDYVDAPGKLIVVFEPVCDRGYIAGMMSKIAHELPDAHVVGMTTLGPLTDQMQVPEHTVVSLLLFESAGFSIDLFDCNSLSPAEAGMQMSAKLESTAYARGVMVMSSCVTMCPAPFLDVLIDRHPDIVLFGAQAGAVELSDDQSFVFADGVVSSRSILAVTFAGEDLHLHYDYNLGWRPLGKEMTLTGVASGGVVEAIDGKPAMDTYRKYLGIEPDEFFYENVCAFPLLKWNGKRLIARVPMSCDDEGKLLFSMDLPHEAHVTLSYSKPQYLLHETLEHANQMAAFGPQAVLLFACMNRRIFMGNERADREFDYYRKVDPQLAWTYGYGEILKTVLGGGVLNSSIVAVGMREGGAADEVAVEPYVDPELVEPVKRSVPLLDRLITFLEAVSSDVRVTIDELSVLAQRDTLTGLYNRRFADSVIAERLQGLASGGARSDDQVVLMMYDIDHFKSINDTYGHDVGDVVLRDLTARVNEVARSGDILCRWGGEEFIFVLSGMTLDQARGFAERVRRHVEEERFDPVGHVSVSVGVTDTDSEDTPETAFNRVDRALYEAKNAGRNCVRVLSIEDDTRL